MTKKPTDAPKDPPPHFQAQLQAAKQQSTLQLLFKAARLLDEAAIARLGAQLGNVQLRRSHSALLPHLDLEGTRQSVLAERLGISKQAVAQLVDDLEALDMVSRQPDPQDARAKRICFTARGRKGLLQGLNVLQEMEQELARQLGEHRVGQLHATLCAILKAIEPQS